VHPFWLSHVEKHPCLELNMGGQPWPDLSSWKAAMGAHGRGREGGRGEGGGRGRC
jgi:hypothetical protein